MYIRYFIVPLLIAGITHPAEAQERSWQLGGSGGVSFAESEGLSLMGDETTVPGSLQPWELRPDVNLLPRLTAKHGWSEWQFPFDLLRPRGLPRLWRGYQNENEYLTMFRPLHQYVDGDRTTFTAAIAFGPPNNKVGAEFYTIDPGALLPLERFVIQEPPEDVVDRNGEPFANYIPQAGELSGSKTEDFMLARDLAEERRFNPTGRDVRYAPLPIELGNVGQNFAAPLVVEFAPQYLRFLRWRTLGAPITGDIVAAGNIQDGYIPKLAYAEFEIFGRGFAPEARYTTHVVDLGEPITLGRVLWGVSRLRRVGADWIESTGDDGTAQRTWNAGELVEAPDAEAQISIRIRNGLDDDPQAYHTWSNKGALVEVDRDEWEALKRRNPGSDGRINFRGPVTDDHKNWTPWSGRVTQSEFSLNLPGRQYFQVEVELSSQRPTDTVRLDSLIIELFPLLARTIVAEVGLASEPLLSSLVQFPIGEPSRLLYAVKANFAGGGDYMGFDAIRIEDLRLALFDRLLMGDPLAPVEPDSVISDSEGLTLFLPQPVLADEEVRVELEATLYNVSMNLRGEVFNRANAGQRQQVEEGDATGEIGTDRLRVIATENPRGSIIEAVRFSSPVVTPNGDGVNDRIEIDFTLFGVLSAEVDIAFYALSGQQVAGLSMRNQPPGVNQATWSGLDETGAPLPPGVYLCRLTARTHREEFEVTRALAVAY